MVVKSHPPPSATSTSSFTSTACASGCSAAMTTTIFDITSTLHDSWHDAPTTLTTSITSVSSIKLTATTTSGVPTATASSSKKKPPPSSETLHVPPPDHFVCYRTYNGHPVSLWQQTGCWEWRVVFTVMIILATAPGIWLGRAAVVGGLIYD
ncbi:hypothetical protein FN846DRAFT_905640 [Sphaerosporella brunnea]|uniref:Uncharacterized protein n=1 Tax=Sphaerosporella brunnea TaxID=1250544 RepID=A0A5J5F180_9PEZI|nr:hypothetical protein FN846DRAFT_905640 [Sphaerosporella brunnea]